MQGNIFLVKIKMVQTESMHSFLGIQKDQDLNFERSDQPENVNFEPILRGLKNDNFDWD